MRRGLLLAVWVGALGLGACGADPEPTPPAAPATFGGLPRSEFLMDPDRFLPALDPAMVPAAEATFLQPNDDVFGVVVAGRARAYPITMLAYHHVVNDVIQGIPVAITY